MRVYFIRHGQTTGNATMTVQGWTDVDLTDKGRLQAAGAKNLIKDIKFDKIFASDLMRTRTTAGIIFPENEPHPDIIWDRRLREIDNTVLAGIHRNELVKKYGDKFTDAIITLDYTYFGGESSAHLLERTADFLHFLEQYSSDGVKKIAVVTHGGVISAAVAYLLGSKINNRKIAFDNCSISEFKYINGEWKIACLNYTGALDNDTSEMVQASDECY